MGGPETKDKVFAETMRLDAVYTWNVVIQRINQAAHWREEFREMQNADDEEDLSDDDITSEKSFAVVLHPWVRMQMAAHMKVYCASCQGARPPMVSLFRLCWQQRARGRARSLQSI